MQFSIGEGKKRFGRPDELRSEVRAVFPVLDCPKGAGDWDYKVIVDLLDVNGRILDRFDNDGSCSGEMKTVSANHSVLKAVVPAIRGVRIRLQAEKD